MIYFTLYGSNKSVAINPQFVVSVEPSPVDPSLTKINTSDNRHFYVTDTQYTVVGNIVGALKA